MSKIEVLRVPDEQIPHRVHVDGSWIFDGDTVEEGDLTLWRNDEIFSVIPLQLKPALLAALLEDTGAARVDVLWCPECESMRIDAEQYCAICGADPNLCEAWLLPIPEDTP